MSQSRIKNALSILRHATNNNLTIVQASQELGQSRDVVSKTIKAINDKANRGVAPPREFGILLEARDEFEKTEKVSKNGTSIGLAHGRRKTKGDGIVLRTPINSNPLNLSRSEVEDIEYDANVDKAYDERSKGETLRGKETFTDSNTGTKLKRITGYKYKILIRDEKALVGTLTREQMDALYRLYSGMDGAGMTLRAVSREFPDLSYKDFKRIIRAFNVTKSSLPVSPHIMEEMSTDEIVKLVHRNKEHTILKRVDNERHKYYEKRYFDSQKEISDIKSEFQWVDSILDSFFTKDKIKELFKNSTREEKKNRTKKTKGAGKKPVVAIGKPVITIFGDVHYGKKFDSPIFGRGYNKDIAHERVMKIAEEAVLEVKRKNSQELVLLSMGDILESSMEEGIHAGHFSEMDLHQAEQIFFAVESMIKMIEYVVNNTEAKITFASIHGNHDRMAMGRDEDKSRTGGKIVSGFVERMIEGKYPKRVNFIIPDNNLFKMVTGNLCIFAQHGDSGLSKKKPSELLTLFGEGRECYNVFFKGHWHYLKTEEGTNTLAIQVPAVTSTDKYILEEVGSNCLPGFLIGSEPEQGRGFDFKKVTLY